MILYKTVITNPIALLASVLALQISPSLALAGGEWAEKSVQVADLKKEKPKPANIAGLALDWALAEKACGAKPISMRPTITKIAAERGEDLNSESFKNFLKLVTDVEGATLAQLLMFDGDVDADVLEEHRLMTVKERGGCVEILRGRDTLIKENSE